MDESATDAALDALVPRLRQFVVVAREEHLTRAAEVLGVPQPTLSRSIARLEAELGVPLFTRPGRSIRLTRHGRFLYESAERALAPLSARLRGLIDEADPARGRVALGFLHTLGGEAVPRLLRDFRAQHPQVRFALVQGSAHMLPARLRDGEIDLCLTAPLPPAADGVTARKLDEQRIDLFVPAGSPAGGAAAGSGWPKPRRRTSSPWSRATACGRSPMTCAARRASSRGSRSRERRRTRPAAWWAPDSACPCCPPPRHRWRTRPSRPVRITAPKAARTVGIAWPTDRPLPAAGGHFRDFALTYAGRLPETESARPAGLALPGGAPLTAKFS